MVLMLWQPMLCILLLWLLLSCVILRWEWGGKKRKKEWNENSATQNKYRNMIWQWSKKRHMHESFCCCCSGSLLTQINSIQSTTVALRTYVYSPLFISFFLSRNIFFVYEITIFSDIFGWYWFWYFYWCSICIDVVRLNIIIIIRHNDTANNFLIWIIIFIIDLMSGYNWCYQITCCWCIACAHNWWRWNRVNFLHFCFSWNRPT